MIDEHDHRIVFAAVLVGAQLQMLWAHTLDELEATIERMRVNSGKAEPLLVLSVSDGPGPAKLHNRAPLNVLLTQADHVLLYLLGWRLAPAPNTPGLMYPSSGQLVWYPPDTFGGRRAYYDSARHAINSIHASLGARTRAQNTRLRQEECMHRIARRLDPPRGDEPRWSCIDCGFRGLRTRLPRRTLRRPVRREHMILSTSIVLSPQVRERREEFWVSIDGAWALHRVRIYEQLSHRDIWGALPDDDRTVIQDALLERSRQRREEADKVLDDTGIVGRWRPSTVIVHSFTWLGGNYLLASNVLAHTLWDHEFARSFAENGHPVSYPIVVHRGDAFQLALNNDEEHERRLFIHVICKPYAPPRNGRRP